jgi:hypothetical protein
MQVILTMVKMAVLIKRNANANLSILQHILAVNPHYLAALDTGKLSFFPR